MRWLTLLSAFYGTTAVSLACCVVSSGPRVQLANEKVIIIWDPQQKLQHFVRQAKFDTEAKDFGFIVPTPTVPTLAKVNEGVYPKLEALAAPLPNRGSRSSGNQSLGLGGGG